MIATSPSRPLRHSPHVSAGVPGASAIEDLVGGTPLVRLKHLTAHLPPGVAVYGKAEFFNPGGMGDFLNLIRTWFKTIL